MRYAFAAILIAFSLAAAPVQAKAPADFFKSIPHDFATGARFYFETVGGWLSDLFDLLGLSGKLTYVTEGGDCVQATRCSLGLVCVNDCEGGDCDVYAKRCLKGPDRVDVLGEYSTCGESGEICSDGTFCARVCPRGADCGGVTHRCMRPIELDEACAPAADCRAACAKYPFAPIGPSAYVARCGGGSCACEPVVIAPEAERVECPPGLETEIACPAGTHPACTPAACPSGICQPYLTCLSDPAYGGICLDASECADSECAEGASPFCDGSDRRCKCRSSEIKTIACASPSDCEASLACGANDVHACVEGACACQRVTENVPVACQDVDQCGGVSCPAGFDKACIDAKCACTRTVQQ